MKRLFIVLFVCLFFAVLYVDAQKPTLVPRNLPEWETVYYLAGQNLYHTKTCPDLVGVNPFATNVWTMRGRDMEPCPKCLYKEIPSPEKIEPIKEIPSSKKTAPVKTNISETSSRSIAKWEGSAIKNTESFSISSSEWTIAWATNRTGNFMIYVYNADTNDMVDLAANIIGSGKDYSVIRGRGRYYLKIVTSQPYTIEIFEKK